MEHQIALLLKLGRMKAHMTFLGPSLNELMLEFHPTNRVLTGESIVFQSEMLEILKETICHSTHPLTFEGNNPLNFGF